MLAHNVAKGVAKIGKYAANGQNKGESQRGYFALCTNYLFILLFCVPVSSGQYPAWPQGRKENKKWKEILQIEIKCPEVQNAGQHYKENPVKPPEVVTKCTDSHALSYRINHSNRRLARLGEKLRRKGRRYGSQVQIKI